jgi:hypothetical protein
MGCVGSQEYGPHQPVGARIHCSPDLPLGVRIRCSAVGLAGSTTRYLLPARGWGSADRPCQLPAWAGAHQICCCQLSTCDGARQICSWHTSSTSSRTSSATGHEMWASRPPPPVARRGREQGGDSVWGRRPLCLVWGRQKWETRNLSVTFICDCIMGW